MLEVPPLGEEKGSADDAGELKGEATGTYGTGRRFGGYAADSVSAACHHGALQGNTVACVQP